MHSPFPWSEGVSYVFDANDKVVCREPLLPELEGERWSYDRELIAAVPALIEALEHATELLVDTWNTAMEGDPEREVAVADARAVLTSIGRTK